jgi:hypothetical protein
MFFSSRSVHRQRFHQMCNDGHGAQQKKTNSLETKTAARVSKYTCRASFAVMLLLDRRHYDFYETVACWAFLPVP